MGENIKDYMTGDDDMGRKIYAYLKTYIFEQLKGQTINIVEIGCGSGAKLEAIRTLAEEDNINVSMFGCDFSEQAVKAAQKKGLIVYKGASDSLKGIKADIIILSHVVEHFIDLKSEFEHIKEILKNGAYIYIEVPGVCDLVNKGEYGYNYLTYSVMAHIFNFNLASLRSVIEPLGFKFIAGDEYVRSIFCFDLLHRSAVDVSNNYNYIMLSLKNAEEKRIKIESSYKARFLKYIRRRLHKALKI